MIISMVDLCSAKLVSLDLRGYRDLNDLVLEYVAGATPQNEGKGEYKRECLKVIQPDLWSDCCRFYRIEAFGRNLSAEKMLRYARGIPSIIRKAWIDMRG